MENKNVPVLSRTNGLPNRDVILSEKKVLYFTIRPFTTYFYYELTRKVKT